MFVKAGAVVVAVIAIAAGVIVTTRSDAVTSCSTTSPERTEHVYADLSGVDPELTTLDVYTASNPGDCPALIWVHGGSWQIGSRRTRATTVKAEHFVAQGWVFISIDYRLAADDNDVRWPDFGDDVAAATAWTIDNAERLGIDPERISLIGHSAGAHLVSIVSTNPTLLDRFGRSPSDIGCVVSLDSVTHDLTDDPPWETDIIDLAFPSEADKIDGSPTLQAEIGDPQLGPDVLIITRGRDQRIDSSHRLADTLVAGGGDATVIDVSPYDHGEVNTMLGVADETRVTDPVDSFLDTCR